MFRFTACILACACFLISCKERKTTLFTALDSNSTQLNFNNQLTNSSQLNILNYLYFYNGSGVAAGDFNNDGLLDLYFGGNLVEDQLFLNKGDLTFKKVQHIASPGWTTGVTQIDINNDGLLDIYICKAAKYGALKGHNLLLVNQGNDSEGVPVFQEEAKLYGLDFSGLSTQAAFFDYDLDGDLDMYLMNHSVHPNMNYGKGSQRKLVDEISGDRLYENKGGHFQDVSKTSGIYQGKIGYGLGLSIGDLNADGYPDIYVGNDFFENDYVYINNKNGTFKELITENSNYLGHTTHFSMGNTISDFNNDGLMDIFSLDMLPENLKTYKSSGNEHPYPTYSSYLKNGYAPQYMQNTLHLNRGGLKFSEIAHLSGIAATEWSWGILSADFDNDGQRDLFISNGIPRATNDMDFINFIANENIQKNLSDGTSEAELEFIEKIPSKPAYNYFYKNNGDLTFTDMSTHWTTSKTSFSNGATYADLDNDGDLELIVNNINEPALILKNNTRETLGAKNNFIDIRLKGSKKNPTGIGSLVKIYIKNQELTAEKYDAQGYLSSTANAVHFGIGTHQVVDSLMVRWPNGAKQTLFQIPANTRQLLDIENAVLSTVLSDENTTENQHVISLPYLHKDESSIEFYRDPLIPYANTNEGPYVSSQDFNGDGLEDIFINGAKHQPSSLLLQQENGGFITLQDSLFILDKISEDVGHVFFDANNDGLLDLLVVSGGNEFKDGHSLTPRMYWNDNGTLKKDSLQFKNITVNASTVKVWDMDNDGQKDVIITSDQVPWEFGNSPRQYLFKNDGNRQFTDVTISASEEFATIGNVKDVVAVDLDKNGFQDLVVVGHWMPILIFYNDGQKLTKGVKNGLDYTNGFWNTVKFGDFDQDGDIDLIAGNWGENSKLKAGKDSPVRLYKTDLDNNGTVETLVTYFYKNTETIFASKDELTKQVPSLNKKFLSYKSFAEADLDAILPVEKREQAMKKQVYELRSSFIENIGNSDFILRPLPKLAQISNVRDILFEENETGNTFTLVGNNYEISTQLGRMDALHGLILQTPKNNLNIIKSLQTLGVSGANRHITNFKLGSKQGYLISRNNDSLIFVAKKERLK